MISNSTKNATPCYGGVDRIDYERMNHIREIKKRAKYIIIALAVCLPSVIGIFLLIK